MTFSTSKTYKKLIAFICGVFISSALVLGIGLFLGGAVYAADPPKDDACPEGYSKNIPNLVDEDTSNDEPCIPSKIKNTGDVALKNKSGIQKIIDKYINPFSKLLAGLVGVVSAISLVYAGIQYASSAGDPGKVQAARDRIVKTVIALLAFLFLFGFLQWLVPGGIF